MNLWMKKYDLINQGYTALTAKIKTAPTDSMTERYNTLYWWTAEKKYYTLHHHKEINGLRIRVVDIKHPNGLLEIINSEA